MEAEVLGLYECIKVVPAAAKAAGEMDTYNESLGFYLVAFSAAMLAAGESAVLITKAERVKVVKKSGEVWSGGEYVYWDDGNSEFTNVEGAATVLCGIISQAALSAATVGFIKFNGLLGNIKGKEIAVGSSAVTGTLADIDTGLSLIQNVQATIMIATQGAGEAAYVTVDHGADGLLDLYVWDDAGVAATIEATIYWIAFGLK